MKPEISYVVYFQLVNLDEDIFKLAKARGILGRNDLHQFTLPTLVDLTCRRKLYV